MRARTIAILAALTLALCAGTWFALRQDGARTAFARADTRPFAGLGARTAELRVLRLTGPGTAVHVERHGDGWRVREKHGFGADTARVRDALAGLGALRLVEARTDDPARYGALDLADPQAPVGGALELALLGEGDAVLARVLLGKARAVRGGGIPQRYVRLPDDARTWLADAPLDPPRDPSLWLDRQVLDIPNTAVRAVEVTLAGQAPYRLERPSAAAPFALTPLPAGRTLDGQRAGAAAYGLQDVTLQNVFRPDEVDADWAQADHARFSTFDGLDVTFSVVRVAGVPNARLAVQAQPGADAGAQARASALAARVQPWVFVLAPHPVSTFIQPADALLAPPPGAAPAQAPAPTPPGLRPPGAMPLPGPGR